MEMILNVQAPDLTWAMHHINNKIIPCPRNVRKQIRAAKQMIRSNNFIVFTYGYSELIRINIEQEVLSWLEWDGYRLSARDAHAFWRVKKEVAAHE